VDFARLRDAAARHSADGWCFVVVTMERRFSDTAAAYRGLSGMTRELLRRIRRRHAVTGWAATVEQHRDGWPHANLLIHSPGLAAELRRDVGRRRNEGQPEAACVLAYDPSGTFASTAFGLDAAAAGWGRTTAEAARSEHAVAGYLVKIAGQTQGELAKVSQVPTRAPKGTRRLRSSRRFLPPRRRGTAHGVVLVRDHGGVRPLARCRYRAPKLTRSESEFLERHPSPTLEREVLRERSRAEHARWMARRRDVEAAIDAELERGPPPPDPAPRWD
jgi:hypothetical protein